MKFTSLMNTKITFMVSVILILTMIGVFLSTKYIVLFEFYAAKPFGLGTFFQSYVFPKQTLYMKNLCHKKKSFFKLDLILFRMTKKNNAFRYCRQVVLI